MKKFNMNDLMNDKSKGNVMAYKIDYIVIDKIRPSKMNNYSVKDISDLKASIELVGLQQNLLVSPMEDGFFDITSGHRRFKALSELVAEGKSEYEKVPCLVRKSADDILEELSLIFANSTTRVLTDYEKTFQAARLKELLESLKKSGYKFTGRTREAVAELMKVSPAQVGRMESINNHLSPELKEDFKNEKINISTAYELSKLGKGEQVKVHKMNDKHSKIEPLLHDVLIDPSVLKSLSLKKGDVLRLSDGLGNHIVVVVGGIK